MNVREWALIIYTILVQMAVGSFVVLGIVHFFANRKAGAEQADRLSDRALLAIGPVIVLGILASLGHLGNPINAPRAVTNIGSSWLSREIFFTMLFMALGAIFAFLQWRKRASFAIRNAIAWLAALVGIVLVYSMSRIYMLDTQPAWNTFGTPLAFYATTFLLGSLAMGSAFVANYAYVKKKEPSCATAQCQLVCDVARWIAVATVVLLGVELVVAPLQLSYLISNGSAIGIQSVSMLWSQFGTLFGLRLAVAFVGAGVFALFLSRAAQKEGQENTLGTLIYAAFALVLVSEVVGRFLFYASHIKIGL
jgi:anaerobic dimethyl sulfoxide reductase subunit C (anchor subunit)